MKYAKQGIIRPYSTGPYNKMNDTEQWIRISQGCPNRCDFCYEPPQRVVFPIPPIERNLVKIMDMNMLSQECVFDRIQYLGTQKVNNKVVHYELICGIDHRFLNPVLAEALKKSRFKKIRLAWDFGYIDQFRIRKALKMLMAVGYRPRNLTVFMICNWHISYEECLKKKLLINCTQGNVLRLMPPLVVKEKEIDKAVQILDEVLVKTAESSLINEGSRSA